MKPKFLFFHYGPGGNCDIEKRWLSHKYPNIEFWDQPKSSSYDQLKMACATKLQNTFGKNPVNIIAHSFGCNIAIDILNEQKYTVENLILLSPVSNLFEAFKNISSRILEKSDLDIQLRNEISIALSLFTSNPSIDLFWSLIEKLIRYPNMLDLYFAQTAIGNRYKDEMTKSTPFDFEMWQTVLSDYLSETRKNSSVASNFTRILIGKFDPYIQLDNEMIYWQKIFPNVLVEPVETGHYPHLESMAFSAFIESL